MGGRVTAALAALDSHRRAVRYVAAAMAAAMAAMYFLIGFRIVAVVEDVEAQPAFGIPAGIGFAVAAVVLVLLDRRSLWIAGAVFQTLIIYTYFNLASQRTPAFEAWGILIRVAQVVILGALVILALRPPEGEPARGSPGARAAGGG